MVLSGTSVDFVSWVRLTYISYTWHVFVQNPPAATGERRDQASCDLLSSRHNGAALYTITYYQRTCTDMNIHIYTDSGNLEIQYRSENKKFVIPWHVLLLRAEIKLDYQPWLRFIIIDFVGKITIDSTCNSRVPARHKARFPVQQPQQLLITL